MRATITPLVPGLLLCGLVTACAFAMVALEIHFFQRAWLETLVIAIVLGSLVRSVCQPGACFDAGIHFGAKVVLEIAVVLLGVAVDAATILEQGPKLVFGIAALVLGAIALSYGIGRLSGLSSKLAVMIACGNAICGNSAIAAVAPVIDADIDDVAAAISFTAVLGIVVVLVLPLMIPLLSLNTRQFGMLAGLTVYAVPQVLAATASVSALSTQVGTLIKLVRVMMLGPVVLLLSVMVRKDGQRLPALGHMVPWFILGFLLMVGLRSLALIPNQLIAPLHDTSEWLTMLSMAALGLGVDVRSVSRAGPKVASVVTLSLMILFLISIGLIHLIPIR